MKVPKMPGRFRSLFLHSDVVDSKYIRRTRRLKTFLLLTLLTTTLLVVFIVFTHARPDRLLLTLSLIDVLMLIAVLLEAAWINIPAALELAHKQQVELEQKNRELEEAQHSLERRVAERTKEILTSKRFFEALVQTTPLAVVTLDLKHRIIGCNTAFEKIFGYTASETIGQELDSLIATPELKEAAVEITRRVKNGETVHTSGKRRRKDGSLVEVEIYGVPVILDEVQVGVLGFYEDVTERNQARAILQHLATHDPLTDLPNRSLFYDRLNHALSLSRRTSTSLAVIFLDMDGFKAVNDLFGHEAGDKLLQALAIRFTSCLRACDTVARMGGDEFTFVFENVNTREDAAQVAHRIMNALLEPFGFDHHSHRISASLGISIWPEDGDDAETLLKHADAAMYQAKEDGKNTFRFFSNE